MFFRVGQLVQLWHSPPSSPALLLPAPTLAFSLTSPNSYHILPSPTIFPHLILHHSSLIQSQPLFSPAQVKYMLLNWICLVFIIRDLQVGRGSLSLSFTLVSLVWILLSALSESDFQSLLDCMGFLQINYLRFSSHLENSCRSLCSMGLGYHSD